MTSANVDLRQFRWANRLGEPVTVTARVALDDPAGALKLAWARSIWLAIDDLTGQEAIDLADRWCPVEELVREAKAYAARDARVTTTLTWHRWSDESPFEVTVTVPASWGWASPYESDRQGPAVLAEAFYNWCGPELATPQECCDFLGIPGQGGMRRFKQLIAWRRAQLHTAGSFDWTDYTTAFAVAP